MGTACNCKPLTYFSQVKVYCKQQLNCKKNHFAMPLNWMFQKHNTELMLYIIFEQLQNRHFLSAKDYVRQTFYKFVLNLSHKVWKTQTKSSTVYFQTFICPSDVLNSMYNFTKYVFIANIETIGCKAW